MLSPLFFCGAVCYADDLTQLAALRAMLWCCEEYGCEHRIKFNLDKMQCICSNWFVSLDFLCDEFVIAVHVVGLQDEVIHSSHFLDSRLDDVLMSAGSLLSLSVLRTVLGFISWGVFQMLLHSSFGLIRQPSMES